MKKSLAFAALFALLTLAAVPQANAQAQIKIGPRLGYEANDIEELFVGADLRVSTPAVPVTLNGTADYFLLDNDNVNLLRFTFNGLYEFGYDNAVFTPYAGAGLSITRVSFDADDDDPLDDAFFDESATEAGLNLVGGAEFSVGSVKPFVQAEFVVGSDYDSAAITGGLLFTIGG